MRQKLSLTHNDFFGIKESGNVGVLIAFYWTITTLPFFARGVIVRVIGDGIVDYIIPFFFIVAIFLSIKTIIKSSRIWDYILMVLLISGFIGSFSWYPYNKQFLMEYEDQFLYWSLPFFVVGISTEFQKCQRLLYVFSVFAIVLQLLSLLTSGVSVNEQGEMEAMGRAYGILPPVLFMIWKAFEDKKSISKLVAVIGFLDIVFMGTRGPFLVVVEFVALFLLFFCKFKNPVGMRVIIVILVIICFLFLQNFFDLLLIISDSLGLSTRVIEFYSDSSNFSEMLVESSGRDIIFDNIIEAIGKAPFGGYGPAADRVYSGFYDAYAHNIVLEMLLEYGVVPGTIILLSVVAVILFAFIASKDHDTKIFILICVSCGFLGLMTSGTYLTSRAFFYMLGVCVSAIRNSKQQLSNIKRAHLQ